MTSTLYNSAKTALLNGGIDLLSDTLKVALVSASYVPDVDTHQYYDDVTDEISGTGYTAGGKTLTGKTITQDDANDCARFDAADPTWSVSTFTTRAAVIYIDTGTPATSPLLAYVDFSQDYSQTGEDFTIEWHADGVLTLGAGA